MTAKLWISGHIGAAAALATALIGCAPAAEDGSDKAAAPAVAAPAVAAPADGARTTHSLMHAQLDVPTDWAKNEQGAWMVFAAADGISHIAVGPMEAGDVPATKLQEAAAALGATSVVTVDEQATTFGTDKLPARAADGSCKLGRADARIGYVVVDLGGGNRVMAVHAAGKDSTDVQLQAGRKAIASLRRL